MHKFHAESEKARPYQEEICVFNTGQTMAGTHLNQPIDNINLFLMQCVPYRFVSIDCERAEDLDWRIDCIYDSVLCV